MTDEQARPHPVLTPTQATRTEFARRTLDYARSEDLAHLDTAGLILLVERLRGRLGDVIDLVDEIAAPTPQRNDHP
jgi:hypothetical protein